jgi:hypothetical protein
MLRADFLEDVGLHSALNAAQRIPAQNIHVVRLEYLIGESRRDSSLSAEAFRRLADALIKRDCVKLTLAYVPPPWQNCGGHLVGSLVDYRMSWQKWRWISFPRRTCKL